MLAALGNQALEGGVIDRHDSLPAVPPWTEHSEG
ncbi:protein of unknown function [Azospirillum baldaniorum]|uniref:Uncharacterized protein n=1 Tax=Azospirillum baldaniorum TaxID=1064539 RepID=A0A9P1JT07_9PROT|nr:protein of unknown function [Azospirillum baldaniorum]